MATAAAAAVFFVHLSSRAPSALTWCSLFSAKSAPGQSPGWSWPKSLESVYENQWTSDWNLLYAIKCPQLLLVLLLLFINGCCFCFDGLWDGHFEFRM